ncbi:MAG TPA: hypothetical protein DCM45_05375, partial [Clostridiales bacterium]|nr:hypothetical protein [Clostridiales bacterium]
MMQQDFQAFECELTVYRHGCLQVRVNLDQGTMIWKDSRQWCNNFVRTLSDNQIDEFRELASLMLKLSVERFTDQLRPDPASNDLETLIFTIIFENERLTLEHAQIDPEAWSKLRRMI